MVPACPLYRGSTPYQLNSSFYNEELNVQGYQKQEVSENIILYIGFAKVLYQRCFWTMDKDGRVHIYEVSGVKHLSGMATRLFLTTLQSLGYFACCVSSVQPYLCACVYERDKFAHARISGRYTRSEFVQAAVVTAAERGPGLWLQSEVGQPERLKARGIHGVVHSRSVFSLILASRWYVSDQEVDTRLYQYCIIIVGKHYPVFINRKLRL